MVEVVDVVDGEGVGHPHQVQQLSDGEEPILRNIKLADNNLTSILSIIVDFKPPALDGQRIDSS